MNLFLDFERFPALKQLTLVELDTRNFMRIEAMFDALVRVLSANWKARRF